MIVDIRALPVSPEWNHCSVVGALDVMEAYIGRHARKATAGTSILFIADGVRRTLVQAFSPRRAVLVRRVTRRRKAAA
jgi:hypothetical protein